MDANVVSAVFVDLDGQGVVEVPGGLGIDGEDPFLAEIFAGLQFVLRNTKKGVHVQQWKLLAGSVNNSRPGDGRETLQHILSELLSREIAVFEQGAGLDLNVTDRPEFLNKGSKGMQ